MLPIKQILLNKAFYKMRDATFIFPSNQTNLNELISDLEVLDCEIAYVFYQVENKTYQFLAIKHGFDNQLINMLSDSYQANCFQLDLSLNTSEVQKEICQFIADRLKIDYALIKLNSAAKFECRYFNGVYVRQWKAQKKKQIIEKLTNLNEEKDVK